MDRCLVFLTPVLSPQPAVPGSLSVISASVQVLTQGKTGFSAPMPVPRLTPVNLGEISGDASLHATCRIVNFVFVFFLF